MDVLGPGLTAIFCGINRPPSFLATGHNFATPSNRFWTVLHRAGFTPERLLPADERRLLGFGYGITAVVERVTSRAGDLSAHEFVAARADFEARVRSHRPRAIAFLGKPAVAALTNRTDVAWGRQPTRFADVPTWVLPNPSGLNRSFSLELLVGAYTEFRIALANI